MTTFYQVVHQVFNDWTPNPEWRLKLPFCLAPESPYEPDDHACYELAGELRVGLDAAGFTLDRKDGAE